MPVEPIIPSEGRAVLHLFFHVRRDALEGAGGAARDFAARIDAFDQRDGYQVLAFSVLGQKADFGLMALGPDLTALDRFTVDLAASPLGQALLPAASYLSLTETSEYTPTEADEAKRLIDEDGLDPTSDEYDTALSAFRHRMETYAEHRLRPQLPARRVICFYPMSKRRDPQQNWYALDFAERKDLMAGHAKVGRTYRGRVLQLITGSVGLDDWEWGVTLLADDPAAIKQIVYEMRFDEVSAGYAEFGPFVTGLVMPPMELMRHLQIAT
ncbi:MAG TPA: chlorite dismutase family protein [Euzebyales bacterium]|nr:chlorite dismutase family protein [Euzebyales bacterium]